MSLFFFSSPQQLPLLYTLNCPGAEIIFAIEPRWQIAKPDFASAKLMKARALRSSKHLSAFLRRKGTFPKKGAASLKVAETSGIEGHLRPLSLPHPDVYLHVFLEMSCIISSSQRWLKAGLAGARASLKRKKGELRCQALSQTCYC